MIFLYYSFIWVDKYTYINHVPRGTQKMSLVKNSYKSMKIKDFLVSNEEFSVVLNKTHGYLETHPQPGPESLAKYYESEAYISHTDSKKGILAFLYQTVKRYALQSKIKSINKLNGGVGSVLDIGAGTGDFLKAAAEKSWVVQGVEINPAAREIAKSKNIELFESIDDFQGETFDVVTLWHVLEHLPDLYQTVQKIEALVKEGGTLVIAVPNFNSKDAAYYQNFWAAYDVPRHLWHFSQASMRSLFSSEFELVKTKPMVFDAFYVSLLSEKYKSGNNFSLHALWIGFLSNWSAMKTKEYSSLIYCFKKAK